MGKGRRWRFKNLKTLRHFISTWWILVLIFIPTILVMQNSTKFHIEIYIYINITSRRYSPRR